MRISKCWSSLIRLNRFASIHYDSSIVHWPTLLKLKTLFCAECGHLARPCLNQSSNYEMKFHYSNLYAPKYPLSSHNDLV